MDPSILKAAISIVDAYSHIQAENSNNFDAIVIADSQPEPHDSVKETEERPGSDVASSEEEAKYICEKGKSNSAFKAAVTHFDTKVFEYLCGCTMGQLKDVVALSN